MSIKIDDLSLNILEKDDSIIITETSSVRTMAIFLCRWGEARFGDPCILGEGLAPGDYIRTFKQLNIIRTA